METMVQRALRQGQVERRADDCEVAIYQRLETHYTLCEPILTFYQQKNLLRNILAEAAPENIFAKCCSVIERLKGRSLTNLEGHGGREQPHLEVAAVAAPATHTCGPSHLGSERDTWFFGAGIQP
ncbi:adenylate kinase isoenzyme 1-like isoform X2 [Hippopotamus amphibius kiboko]|uniref:adenylate kinase isoenzyme 1-like isoform X2 n=1 Tax=Hippopotamus amphibius kiboko TaxID=575201 RepID=UPI002595B9DE|nr:adenylate kinase isoenzyme 1-like isoform X2 [Hippopotamus amphibius kiboko]